MKKKSIISRVAQFVIIILLCANAAVAMAAAPEITVNYIPPIGQKGYAEGKVIWDNLNSENVGQYAVIAMLHAVWTGGGGYYVKPYNNNYLNSIDATGNFSINITTGENDPTVDEVIFYVVERKNFSGSGETLNPTAMAGKYLTTKTIFRSSWVYPPKSPESNIRPGFVKAGTEIKINSQDNSVIRYTLDGSNPITSSTANTLDNTVFKVPENGALLIKAVAKNSDTYSSVSSLLWLPEEQISTPFFGLNISLALNGETFGYKLSESITRERMMSVVKLTKWVRTFGTINNGQEYINKIAKELGLKTMIGLYITNNETNNNAQIEGLRQILLTGKCPDLIAIGNETSLSGVTPAILASCIDAVRDIVLKQGLVIPIGSVDIAGASWGQSNLEKLDFIGVNIYSGVWDNTPENQIFDALKQTFDNSIAAFPSKLILLTETGVPYNGGSYSVPGGMQTASKEKAANFLCRFLEWRKQYSIPSFYFEAYDEPTKSMNGGHPVEQFFGIMDGNMKIHSFYENCLNMYLTSIINLDDAETEKMFSDVSISSKNGTLIIKPQSDIPTKVEIFNLSGQLLKSVFCVRDEITISGLPRTQALIVRVF